MGECYKFILWRLVKKNANLIFLLYKITAFFFLVFGKKKIIFKGIIMNTKTILLLVMACSMLLIISCYSEKATEPLPYTEPLPPEVGDLLKFGIYQWCVLEIKEDKVLIMSKDILLLREYHTSLTAITWDECGLRAYLNSTFYNSTAFTAEERAQILPELIDNEANPEHGTPRGSPSLDRIFLLSIAEVQQYFEDKADRIAKYDGEVMWWWLRSPGSYSFTASNVDNEGKIYLYGNGVYGDLGGIRPAMWVKL